MVLMVAVFIAWSALFKPDPPPPGQQQELVEGQTPAQGTNAGATTPSPAPLDAYPAAQAQPLPDTNLVAVDPTIPATGNLPLRQEAIQTELYTATVTNDGGSISSFLLKKYNDEAGPEGTPQELIWTSQSGLYSLATEFVGATTHLRVTDDFEFIEKTSNKVVMRRVCPSGLEVTKTMIFNADNYIVDLTVGLKNLSAIDIQGETRVVTYSHADKAEGGMFSPPKDLFEFQALIDNDFESKQVFKVSNEKQDPKPWPGQELAWGGFTSKYFLQGVAPKTPRESKIVTRHPQPGMVESVVTSFNKRLAPGESFDYEYTFYIGPKIETFLVDAGHGFERSRDFGFFSVISLILVRVLNFFAKYVHNYGIAILILTFIIKILMFPLTQKSFKSMKAMSKLQPQMKELKEKYGEDKNALNQKMMELYRKNKVNPASGCLPMLLQLPIFFAFYKALYSSIELRHTPFFAWIQDLSAPDPYYITPILMGASMVLTQKMTPSSADPMQQKMMMAMPIVFTFMFLQFPSGLVLYWLTSNILSIAQQMYINKQSDDDEEPTIGIQPRAKKAR
jgi:YidC/Oxa1 family membrane protein insertase